MSKEECPKPLKILPLFRVLWYNIYMENKEMQTSNTEEMVTISVRNMSVCSKKKHEMQSWKQILLPVNRNRRRSSPA